MKIYTKTGDDGSTGLSGGGRVRKDDPRIEAIGTVDELNAVLGMARAAGLPADIEELLARIQNELFDLGAFLAISKPTTQHAQDTTEHQFAALETAIDSYDAGLPPLRNFILPAGTPSAACLHLARTVCRRAERRVFMLASTAESHVSPQIAVYLNRLSDLLFVLARATNAAAGKADALWKKSP
jgi:cob(I)alamin adenosyltransferase